MKFEQFVTDVRDIAGKYNNSGKDTLAIVGTMVAAGYAGKKDNTFVLAIAKIAHDHDIQITGSQYSTNPVKCTYTILHKGKFDHIEI